MPTKSKKKKQEAESKKAAQKKKEKLVEDKTFGLKNKKKSKVVQNQIKSIERNVMNSGDPKQRKAEEERRKAKANRKAAKKAADDERNALFGEALMAVQKKSTTNKAGGKVEAKGRDAGDDEKKGGTSRAMKMMYQMDAKEMEDKLKEDPNYVPTLEDDIEAQRQAKVKALKASGKKGTPITEESFRAWRERKMKRKNEEAKKLVEAELKKKKGGKGLAVLSGRALYEYKKELFVDDEGAADASEVAHLNGVGGEGEEATPTNGEVNEAAEKVRSDLFLEGDDDDLDDLDDIDDD